MPTEVGSLTVAPDEQTVSWTAVAPSPGPGLVYDVARGSLSEIPADGGADESCVPWFSGTSTLDLDTPGDAQGSWYLVRGRNACAPGTYGFRSDGTEQAPVSCP